ncbi:unnamed protein product [Scytosiphon promiscuus]
MFQGREGLGDHAMWGFTPAQDLLRESPLKGEANILVCQPGDIGHVLRTIGMRRRHPQHTINASSSLYVWESQIAVLARHLLLLRVAQDWELPIRQRANVFLEIFGNCSVQDRTSRYIARLGKDLGDLLFSSEATADIVDLSLLKFKERDQLEDIFKSWCCNVPCNIMALRDAHLRAFFGVRYDHRKNLVDWDYTNRLKGVAGVIHHTQYRNWRLGGIAYEFGDQVYDQPNRTMMSHAKGTAVNGKRQGLKRNIRGFSLDVRVGPFITFGVDCERTNAYAEDLFAVLNKGSGTEQHRHNTAEVAVYSILSYLWGFETRGQYTMKKKNDIYSGLGDDSSNVLDSHSVNEQREWQGKQHSGGGRNVAEGVEESSDADSVLKSTKQPSQGSTFSMKKISLSSLPEQPPCSTKDRAQKINEEQALERAECIVEAFDGVKVFMLSGELDRHLSKPHYHHFFDRVHLGLTTVDVVGSALTSEALADRAVITMDTGRYMVPFNEEQQRKFVGGIFSLASEQGWEPLLGMENASDGSTTSPTEMAMYGDLVGFSFARKPAST